MVRAIRRTWYLSSIELSSVLNSETEVVISGKTSVRDDRVSVFVDSIIPLNQWVARIAKVLTIEINDKAVLENVKKAVAALRPGNTRIVLNLHSENKSASLVLKNTYELGATTAKDLTALGIKVNIE